MEGNLNLELTGKEPEFVQVTLHGLKLIALLAIFMPRISRSSSIFSFLLSSALS